LADQSLEVTRKRMQIGVMLPLSEDTDGGHQPDYAEIRDVALQLEASGFDSAWVYDHLIFRFPDEPVGGIWEVWSILAGLAEATKRVTLGTLVMCTAFRNPAVLAKMAATVDEMSQGRLLLGLGAGWHQPEFDAFGIPFDHLAGRFEEALKIIVPLLREGHVDFHGTYYQAPNCELRPREQRPGGPPILIGASRPRLLRLTATYADSWNTCWLGQPDPLAERRAKLEAACTEVGRDPASLDVTVGLLVAYTPPGQTAEPTRKKLSGSPDDIAEALLAYERLGVAHVICSLNETSPEAIAWLAEAVATFHAAT